MCEFKKDPSVFKDCLFFFPDLDSFLNSLLNVWTLTLCSFCSDSPVRRGRKESGKGNASISGKSLAPFHIERYPFLNDPKPHTGCSKISITPPRYNPRITPQSRSEKLWRFSSMMPALNSGPRVGYTFILNRKWTASPGIARIRRCAMALLISSINAQAKGTQRGEERFSDFYPDFHTYYHGVVKRVVWKCVCVCFFLYRFGRLAFFARR